MTPEQIEAAARRLCDLRGADPYASVTWQNVTALSMARDEIRAWDQIRTAVEETEGRERMGIR